MGRAIWYERSVAVFLSLPMGQAEVAAEHRCHFDGVRVVPPSGPAQRFSGPPQLGARNGPLLPAPALPAGDLRGLIARLAGCCGGLAGLSYTAVAANRLVSGLTLDDVRTSSTVWAITGRIRTPLGRTLPIGWSGRGVGREMIEDPGIAEDLRRMVERIDRAEQAARVRVPVVLSPCASAIILHEAVGHIVEGPGDPQTSLSHRLGARIAADGLDLDDDPLAPGGPARYEYDSEGTRVLGPTAVVRDGIIISQLHSLQSAHRSGAAPTANGRSASSWCPPLPRISNLVCAAGDLREEEMISRVSSGLYIHQLSDGWGNGPEIGCKLVLGEWIHGGERTGALHHRRPSQGTGRPAPQGDRDRRQPPLEPERPLREVPATPLRRRDECPGPLGPGSEHNPMTTEVRLLRAMTIGRYDVTGADCVDLALELALDSAGCRTEFLPVSRHHSRDYLEALALPAWESWSKSVSPARRGVLQVEAGAVSTVVERPGARTRHFHRAYLLVREGNTLLHLGRYVEPSPIRAAPAPGGLEECRDLPVVLGPSATLALVSLLLDECDGRGPSAGWEAIPALMVFDTPRSPHPAQDLPPLVGGGEVVKYRIVDRGRRAAPPGPASGFNASMFVVCTRTECWLQPLGAVDDPGRRNLEVKCTTRAGPVGRCLVIESISPLSGPDLGVTPLECEYRLDDPDGSGPTGLVVVRLRSDPSRILSSVVGAVAAPRPALVIDAITGSHYGTASALLTQLCVGDLIEDSGSSAREDAD